jgi:hypothetical protein
MKTIILIAAVLLLLNSGCKSASKSGRQSERANVLKAFDSAEGGEVTTGQPHVVYSR